MMTGVGGARQTDYNGIKHTSLSLDNIYQTYIDNNYKMSITIYLYTINEIFKRIYLSTI